VTSASILEAIEASKRLFDRGDIDSAMRILDPYHGERAADLQRGSVAAHAVALDGRSAADAVMILTPHLDEPRGLDLVGLSHYHAAITDQTGTLSEAVGECTTASRSDFSDPCWEADNTLHIGMIQQAQGSYDIAEAYLHAAHRTAEGCPTQRAFTAFHLGMDARARGDDAAALTLFEESLDIRRSIEVWLPTSLIAVAETLRGSRPQQAIKLIDEAVDVARALRVRRPLALALRARGTLEQRPADLEEALELAEVLGDLTLSGSLRRTP
jgi:tetratricopeptide (TPR) repeat protein